jgi:hypothetical protein
MEHRCTEDYGRIPLQLESRSLAIVHAAMFDAACWVESTGVPPVCVVGEAVNRSGTSPFTIS